MCSSDLRFLVAKTKFLDAVQRMLRDVEGKELPLRQAAVLQRIAVIFRLGTISLVELALVSDDEAAGLQRDDIGLERGRVHRDQQGGFVGRGWIGRASCRERVCQYV